MSQMNAQKPHKDDPTWESVLELLASGGYLARFYKVPRHEISAMSKLYGAKSLEILSRLFAATQRGNWNARQEIFESTADDLRFVMIAMLVRSMKCWVETEAFQPDGHRSYWKVAHS